LRMALPTCPAPMMMILPRWIAMKDPSVFFALGCAKSTEKFCGKSKMDEKKDGLWYTVGEKKLSTGETANG